VPSLPVINANRVGPARPPPPPMQGTVTISATFTPRLERDVNFNVTCNVKNKPTRLSLNVKGEGAAIRQELQLEGGADGSVVALAPKQPNALDFGQVCGQGTLGGLARAGGLAGGHDASSAAAYGWRSLTCSRPPVRVLDPVPLRVRCC
jgi:hypothetical protein